MIFKNKISLGLILLFSLTSCETTNKVPADPYPSNIHIFHQPQKVIFAKTEVTYSKTRDHYNEFISKVDENFTFDGNFRAIASNIRIVDGDTIHCSLPFKDGMRNVQLRFSNVNTPELHHPYNGCDPWGMAAKQYLEVLYDKAKENKLPLIVESPTVSGEVVYDDFGRMLSYIWIGDHLVNIELIEIGLGVMEHANDFGDNNGTKNRYDALAQEADLVRADLSRYPSWYMGGVLDFKPVSGLQNMDPNWDASKDNGKSEGENPAIKDLNYKYIFDFDRSGLKSELRLCREHPDLCK